MLLMKDIIMDGHPTLRLRAKEVELPLNDEDFNTLKSMMELVVNSQDDELAEKYNLRPSVGIAAPQINISKKMFCIVAPDEQTGKVYQLAVVNPKIIAYSEEETYLPSGEGCLSVDEEITGLVRRSLRIRAKVTLVDLETKEETNGVIRLKGFPAIVFQHEYDHLLGVLFTDKIEDSINNANPLAIGSSEEL
jgi:peptide deformylase